MTLSDLKPWSEVLDIKNGRNQKKVSSPNGQYPIYGSGGIMGYANDYLCPSGTTIIGRKGSINNPIFVDQRFWNVDTAFGLIPRPCLDNKYLFYFCLTYNFLKHNKATTLPSLTKSDLLKIQIPLPPLAEQKRIAAILDAADLHRKKTKELITKYDDLSQSLFLDMFGDPVTNPKGWEKKNFEFFASFDTKMTSDFEKYSEYPHIGIGNIEKETGRIFGYNLVKNEDLKSGKYIFGSDHIIYSKIRPNLNKVALPDFNGLCSADSYPLLIKPKNTNRLFFASLLRSKDFLDFILGHSTRTNIPKANKSQMKLFKGVAPPLSLQNKFAAQIKEIEKQKAQAEASLDKAEDLFQSLLQKAFKGEL